MPSFVRADLLFDEQVRWGEKTKRMDDRSIAMWRRQRHLTQAMKPADALMSAYVPGLGWVDVKRK